MMSSFDVLLYASSDVDAIFGCIMVFFMWLKRPWELLMTIVIYAFILLIRG